MKLLFIHSDYFKYEAGKRIESIAEDVPKELLTGEFRDLLTVFCSVEARDEDVKAAVAVKAAGEIQTQLERLKLSRVCLYPYAHLSSSLASPDAAKAVLALLNQELEKQEGLEIHRSPFGWYKAFQISCTGHPLSELSREIVVLPEDEPQKQETGGTQVKTREDIVKEIESRYLLLFSDGKEVALDFAGMKPKHLKKLFKNDPQLSEQKHLLSFLLSEELKGQPSGESPSIKVMQGQELVGYESAADSGHFKLYPKGKLLFNLLSDWAGQIADELDAVEIDTPILYNWEEPDIRGQVESFHERHYTVSSPEGKKFVLRFAADFGLFKMMKNATVSYRHMPVRVYEFSKSFRYEQRGELSGLKRLRAFHMPDLHSFCTNQETGMEDYKRIYQEYDSFASKTGVDFVVSFRIVEEFYHRHKDIICQMLASSGKPAFIELLSQKKHYWAIKTEFQGIDSLGGNCQLSTVQLDVDDSERYDITYVDQQGKEQNCVILHCSIGSVERWIFSLLENAMKMEKPSLPLWVSPTQLRILPVRDEFIPDCEALADQLNCRVDIDDRDLKIGKKIREAEKEWVPLIVVYGEKEKDQGSDARLPVRLRGIGVREMSLEELTSHISEGTRGSPYRKLPLPRLLSQRIKFR